MKAFVSASYGELLAGDFRHVDGDLRRSRSGHGDGGDDAGEKEFTVHVSSPVFHFFSKARCSPAITDSDLFDRTSS